MTFTPKLKPENINRQSGGAAYRLYRVFEVYGPNHFSMLFNQRHDADAVADWHNDTRTFIQKLLSGDTLAKNGYFYGLDGYTYKVRERRVYNGLQYACTTRTEGLPPLFAGVKQNA